MFTIREELINGITHPHVAAMYMKRDYGNKGAPEDVLVIETYDHDPHELEMNGRDDYILEILADLQSLKSAVEKKAGKFSRVDIRCH